MKLKWRNLAIKTIKNDCMVCGVYRDFEGGNPNATCAIAALAIAAKCPPPKKKFNGNGSAISDDSGWTKKAFKAIKKKFGFTERMQLDIQEANDDIRNPVKETYPNKREYLKAVSRAIKERRKSVLRTLEKIYNYPEDYYGKD